MPCTCWNCYICPIVAPLACTIDCLGCLAGCTPCCGFCCKACFDCCPRPVMLYQTESGGASMAVAAEAPPAAQEMERKFFVIP